MPWGRAPRGCVTLLFCCAALPLLLGQGGDEYNGVGEARIVGGNQVTARKRALDRARRDAIVRAVTSRLSSEELVNINRRLEYRIFPRYDRYVAQLSRVVRDKGPNRHFRVEVAAVVLLKRLAQDLQQIHAAPGPPALCEKGQRRRPGVRSPFGCGSRSGRVRRRSRLVESTRRAPDGLSTILRISLIRFVGSARSRDGAA